MTSATNHRADIAVLRRLLALYYAPNVHDDEMDGLANEFIDSGAELLDEIEELRSAVARARAGARFPIQSALNHLERMRPDRDERDEAHRQEAMRELKAVWFDMIGREWVEP